MLRPRDKSGLEAKIFASDSASTLWPRPRHQTFGLGLALILLCNRAFFEQISCKIREFG